MRAEGLRCQNSDHVNAALVIVGDGPFPYAGICNLRGTVIVEKL